MPEPRAAAAVRGPLEATPSAGLSEPRSRRAALRSARRARVGSRRMRGYPPCLPRPARLRARSARRPAQGTPPPVPTQSVRAGGRVGAPARLTYPAGDESATGCSCIVSSPSFVKAAPAAEKISPTWGRGGVTGGRAHPAPSRPEPLAPPQRGSRTLIPQVATRQPSPAFCFFTGGPPASGTLEPLGGGAAGGGDRTPEGTFLGPFLGDSAGRGMPESS